jgi:Zn-dependent protease with chaperone function
MPSHAESSLEAGLVALKQGDYKNAIAQLEPIASNTDARKVAVLQAKVGLVMAYARSGDNSRAIALCETLTEINNPQVKQWADRALKELTKPKKVDNESKKSETGFVPLKNSGDNSYPGLIPVNALNSSVTQVVVKINNPSSESDHFLPPATNRVQAKNTQMYWRHAGRAKVWQPRHKLNLLPLRLLTAGTFIALFWMMRAIVKLLMNWSNNILYNIRLQPLQFLYRDPTQFLLIVLGILILASPWLLDWLLTNFYGRRQLPKETLNVHSRETVRLLQRYCQQRHWRSPKLSVLPMTAPIALSYGYLPRTARIVVSQGLLEQLADDEIATIYASQLAHIAHGDCMVMSLVLLVTLPIYRLVSQWTDNISNKILHLPGVVISSLAYGVWCLLTGTTLWLSKLRLYYSDRLAAEITGNPNALVRALLKISIGVAAEIEKQEHTPWQLESLNILAPVSHQQSLCLGSIAGQISFESFLMWDSLNPYRRWFTINNSHPIIGDRIQRLCEIARHWHLDLELYLTKQQPLKIKRHSFVLQIAPFLGIPFGLMFAGLLCLIWQIAFAFKLLNLKWIYDDWSFVTGCVLIGISIGTVMRILYFFPDADMKPSILQSFLPDTKSTTVQTGDRLPNLLANPSALPIDSIRVRLVGKLLGRRGTSNSLEQDLILQTNTGLVKLHHISGLIELVNPQDWIGRQITVTGWFRRGATPWIDIQSLQTQNGQTINSLHLLWSMVLAVATLAWGGYILLTG